MVLIKESLCQAEIMAFDLMDFRGVGDGVTKNIKAIKVFFFF